MRARFLSVTHKIPFVLASALLIAPAAPLWATPLDTVEGVLDGTLARTPGDGESATRQGVPAIPTVRESPIDRVLDRNSVPSSPASASRSASPAPSTPPRTSAQPRPCDRADDTAPCRTPDTSLEAVLPGRLLQRVYFMRNSATLDESGKQDLANFARLYSRRIGDLVLVGATQKTPGDMPETDQLGLERALAVETVLRQNGLGPSRLRVTEAAATEGRTGDYVEIRLDGY
ncbi:outer membrane protein OmpA-like peptidoglycan-associated protein [Parvibaculum indicum]|uniref:OmpA family protein n=1 Tax=Parvibaculum indicum TaxID=562969 RepID=UPI00141F1E43|nr:OmpA family protein [Parvibaculum indicum]NIJ40489.1 outer membrane protein OmpA-like peptidoglycan-associated protein [Parvibaculum indicum]